MKITTGFLTGNLLPDTTGLDEYATIKKYAEILEKSIQEAYPAAEISVEWQNAEGERPYNLRTAVHDADNCQQEEEIIQNVDLISDQVFSAGEFYVTA